jgi:predicted MFS family arabinose efflux permease
VRETWRTPAGRGFIILAATMAAFGFAVNTQSSIVTNYLDGVLGLSGPQFGYFTAVRETGGLILIFLTALFYRVSLQKLTAGALVVLGLSYALFSAATDFWTVLPWTFIGSLGLHTVLQTQVSLGMSLTTENKTGSVLGRVSAVGQVGTFIALVLVYLSFKFHLLSYTPTFIILGVVAVLGAFAIIRFPHLHEGQVRKVAPKRERLVFRRAYRYYYLIVFLDGARQQVFFSFGLWVLVHHFGLGVANIALVMLGVTFGCMLTASRLGRRIDRHGERAFLTVINVAYIVALVGYALAPSVWVACVFYLLYAIISPLSYMGAATYLRKISTAADLAPSLAMGLTMQHVAAIVVPVAAGFILNFVGYQVPFYAACGIAVITIFVTLRLNPATQKCAARIAADEAEAVAAGCTG